MVLCALLKGKQSKMSPHSNSNGASSSQAPRPSAVTGNHRPPSVHRDSHCTHIEEHVSYRYCPWCNSLTVPWGSGSPPVGSDPDGTIIEVGPSQSLHEGVNIHDTTELVIVGIVAEYAVRTGVPGIPTGRRLAGYTTPVLNNAARRLSELVIELSGVWQMPNACRPFSVMQVLVFALEYPRMGFLELRNTILRVFPERFGDSATRECSNNRDIVGNDSGNESDVASFSSDSIEEVDYSSTLQSRHKNAPTASGDWQFIVGSELSPANINVPQASKFFLTRVNTRDLSQIDHRVYPSIAAFDWGNNTSIARLNNWRRQVIARTNGPTNPPRPPYTQKEIDTLKGIIQSSVKQGKTHKTIDWEDVAKQLNSAFEGVIQRKGQPLSQTSRTLKDGTVVRSKGNAVLKQNRVNIHRNGSGVKAQSSKHADIQKLLKEARNKDSVEGKIESVASTKKTKRKAQQEEELSEDSEEIVVRIRRQRKSLRSPPPGDKHKGGPPPPPPSGSALKI